MRIITCAGFYRTGSSAISDFFSEFARCKSLGDYEFRFAQDPDGISDLEYNVCENPHRHNTSHAIKRFQKLSRFLNGSVGAPRYSRLFGDKYLEYTNEFIEDITQLKAKTWWHMDQIERGNTFYFFDRLYAKVTGVFDKNQKNYSLLRNREYGYYTAISKDDFYKAVRKYTGKLVSHVAGNAEFAMFDQLVPPTNVERYLNYFDDIKVICVERDPRDLYVLEKERHRWGVIPYQDVREFCAWYRITRTQKPQEESERVMKIYFEDMIYKYEETAQKLISFVGLNEEDHIYPKKFFIPEKSIRNTRVYEQYPQYASDVEFIEKELKEYLYTNKD